LDFDSIETVECLIEIEDHFEISVPDEVSDKWTTVKEVVDYIEKNQK
jgi:acyl carrier protein